MVPEDGPRPYMGCDSTRRTVRLALREASSRMLNACVIPPPRADPRDKSLSLRTRQNGRRSGLATGRCLLESLQRITDLSDRLATRAIARLTRNAPRLG